MRSKSQKSIHLKTKWTFLSIGFIICGIIFLFVSKISVYSFVSETGIVLSVVGSLILTLFLLKKRYLNKNSYQFLTGIFC